MRIDDGYFLSFKWFSDGANYLMGGWGLIGSWGERAEGSRLKGWSGNLEARILLIMNIRQIHPFMRTPWRRVMEQEIRTMGHKDST